MEETVKSYLCTYSIFKYGLEGWEYEDEDYFMVDTLEEVEDEVNRLLKYYNSGCRSIDRINVYEIGKQISCKLYRQQIFKVSDK